MLLQLPSQILRCFHIETALRASWANPFVFLYETFLLKASENAPGAPWTNSFTFLPSTGIKSQSKMFLEFPEQIPFCFLIKSL